MKQKLSHFLMHVEHNNCFDPENPNPYHTSVHAADVTLTVAHFCENEVNMQWTTRLLSHYFAISMDVLPYLLWLLAVVAVVVVAVDGG